MTISEQLRDAALYAKSPAQELLYTPYCALAKFAPGMWTGHWRSVQGRTFMLLVAEALE